MRFTRSSNGYFFAPNSVIVGDVQIGEESSVWFNAVIRGDVAAIRIGKCVNVQDGVVIHCDTDVANEIGDNITIGHGAIVHGMSVGDGTLVGMSATLLGRTRIGRECLIAAGAVVPPGMVVPDRMCVMGVPGRIVRAVTEEELKYMRWLPPHYLELAQKYERGEIRKVMG
jgi:carbonic anhydrase/acetyltransferase-like protein (isoleucine patch superfamily)